MNELVATIQHLQHSSIRKTIRQRIQEFKAIDTGSAEELFKELCFCILTANFNSERTIPLHDRLHPCFCTDTKEDLAIKPGTGLSVPEHQGKVHHSIGRP